MLGINPGDLLGWAALAGVLILGTRGGIWKNTIAAQKELLAGYEMREEKHQEDLERIKDERNKKDGQTDAALRRLGDRNTYLEELVLRRAEGQELIEVMREHDSEAANRHKGTIWALHAILEAQKKRAEEEAKLTAAIADLATKVKEIPHA